MEICIFFNGKKHCFFLPIFQFPIHWGRPGPGPVNYPALFQDAMIVATLADTAKHVVDDGVRRALQDGIAGSLKNLQQRAGKDVTINAAATEAR
jgi:hypothetical protein